MDTGAKMMLDLGASFPLFTPEEDEDPRGDPIVRVTIGSVRQDDPLPPDARLWTDEEVEEEAREEAEFLIKSQELTQQIEKFRAMLVLTSPFFVLLPARLTSRRRA